MTSDKYSAQSTESEKRILELGRIQLFKLLALAFAFSQSIGACLAGEDLITTAQEKSGEAVPYVLNYNNLSPSYVLILFPGGSGIVDPHMEDGKLVYKAKNNFLLRARIYFVDDEFVTVSTNSTQNTERIQAVIDDLKKRFPMVKIYLVGTSKGTYDTMRLADYLSDKIAGEVHTSSLQSISSFDAKKYANRHLVIHHRDDSCKNTPFSAAEHSHKSYGNDFIAMEGGISVGDPCEAFAHHGYNGIEKETVDAIKKWIKQGS
jgi:hypothetical protein